MTGDEETTIADAVVEGLWEHDDDGLVHLLGGACASCDRTHFPLGPRCPWCGHAPVERSRLDRRATLWGWTAVTAAPPGYEGPIPFGFGVVEQADGLRLVTRLTVADPDVLRFGQPMVLVLDGIGPGGGAPRTWAFAPDAAASGAGRTPEGSPS